MTGVPIKTVEYGSFETRTESSSVRGRKGASNELNSHDRASILSVKRMTWKYFFVASILLVGAILFISSKNRNLFSSAVISNSLAQTSSKTAATQSIHPTAKPTLSPRAKPTASPTAIPTIESKGSKSFNVTYTDFMAFPSVKRLLNKSGAVTDNDIWTHIPKRLEIKLDYDLVHGEIGEQAASGFVAFNLISMSRTSRVYDSSLFVIVSLDGRIEKVFNTFELQEKDTHFCAMKLRDPHTFLLGGDVNTSESGSTHLLKWKEGIFTTLENGTSTNCHDSQWSYSGDHIWQPGDKDKASLEMASATTGENIKKVCLSPFAQDINHAQLIGHDTQAVVSSRLTDALIKVDMEQEEIMWVGSGPAGQLELITLEGEILANGSSLFSGQHNAEYFGENEYMMFDNQYDTGNSSRMLIVHVDEVKKKMTERWSYSFHEFPWGYSPFYGDNDRLPTGNLLSSFWPIVKSGAKYEDVMYDCRASEIDRSSSKKAWDMKVYGKGECEDHICDSVGWRMYSVERFYETPLVHNATCDATNMIISFVAHNNFKQNNEALGSYNLTNAMGVPITSGAFNFSAHWRPAYISFPFNSIDLSHKGFILIVKNQWGDIKNSYLDCV